LTQEEGISLKSFIGMFGIKSWRIFKLDEQSVSLQLIGPEEDVNMVYNLVLEHMSSYSEIQKAEEKLRNLNNLEN
jgi:hypothetical protein